jgi:hypothetical protein
MNKRKLSSIIFNMLLHIAGFFVVYMLMGYLLNDVRSWQNVLLMSVTYGVIVAPLFDFLINKQKI